MQSYASAAEFLGAYDRSLPGCLVLDLKMPGLSGIELQQQLADTRIRLPIIIISGHADVRIAVEVMSRGAMTLLEKPFRLEEIVAHIRRAIEVDAASRAAQAREDRTGALLARLTDKEREVLELIGAGRTNKQIAAALHVSIRAVEDRRARLMKKLRVRSLAELVQLCTVRGESGSDR